MTDRDPAPRSAADRAKATRRTPRVPAGSTAGTPAGATAGATAGTALRDRWWWSPTLSIVIGLVVIGYQLDPLRGDNPLWGNWLVAALGAAVAVWGAVRLVRAARSR